VGQRSAQRFYQTNPHRKRYEQVGLSGLTPAERKSYSLTNLIIPVYQDKVPLSNKAEREFWKTVNKEALPIRHLRKDYDWGKDRTGRDIASYKFDELNQRTIKQSRLAAQKILHEQFLVRRDLAKRTGVELPEDVVAEEKARRKTMSSLRSDLYGEQTGTLAQDPTWDDVIPIPLDEPEGALAQIAYPEDYAEGRAVAVPENMAS
jgi:protein farnesyltransferase/geranylgeranyltransferase type-1 subunit alpha